MKFLFFSFFSTKTKNIVWIRKSEKVLKIKKSEKSSKKNEIFQIFHFPKKLMPVHPTCIPWLRKRVLSPFFDKIDVWKPSDQKSKREAGMLGPGWIRKSRWVKSFQWGCVSYDVQMWCVPCHTSDVAQTRNCRNFVNYTWLFVIFSERCASNFSTRKGA